MRWAIRVVNTLVLPDPAPAITATTVEGVVTAATCAGSSPASSWAARDGSPRAGSAAGSTHPPYEAPGIL